MTCRERTTSPEEGCEAPGRWAYTPAVACGAVEFGTVEGRDVALPPHFHDEDQITFVLAGRRRFHLSGHSGTKAHVETVGAGHGLLIPARSVHRSLAEPAGVICLNVYLPAGTYAITAMVAAAQRRWRQNGSLDHGDLARIVDAHRRGCASFAAAGLILPCSVSERASKSGVSREGFSRAFLRRHGMPPHAHDLMRRLNHARRLLREGEAVAAAASDAGFADQSHLGRCFRRAFGVTPGQYRRGGITNVPDGAREDR